MKIITPLLVAGSLAVASSAQASLLLAGFDNGSSTAATSFATGWSGSITTQFETRTGGGSGDGTYGDFAGPPNPVGGSPGNGYFTTYQSDSLEFSFFKSGASQAFTGLLVDIVASAGAEVFFSYQVNGGGFSTPVDLRDSFTIANTITGTNTVQDYSDLFIPLTGSIGGGDSVDFIFSVDAGARIDNIALTAIPETTGVMALAGLMLSGAFFRRRPAAAPVAATA